MHLFFVFSLLSAAISSAPCSLSASAVCLGSLDVLAARHFRSNPRRHFSVGELLLRIRGRMAWSDMPASNYFNVIRSKTASCWRCDHPWNGVTVALFSVYHHV